MLAGLLFGAGLVVGVALTTIVLRDRVLGDLERLHRADWTRLREQVHARMEQAHRERVTLRGE